MIEFCSATLKHYYYVIYPVDKSGPSSYGSWIYSYLCNQCLSPLMLWVWISIRARCTALCDKVCQWLATSWWFSLGPLVSSTNKTDRHNITEILLKVVLNTIKHANKQTGRDTFYANNDCHVFCLIIMKWRILVEDLPKTIPSKFGSCWHSVSEEKIVCILARKKQ
jgi:hypothetical protein